MISLHKNLVAIKGRVSALLMVVLLSACSGSGLDPILGTPGAGRVPTVTATTPVASTPAVTGVSVDTRVTVTFSEPMRAATINSTSFTLACPAAVAVPSTVSYDVATNVATLTPNAPLPVATTCVATVTAAALDSTGIPLASAFVWSFVTDVSRPRVVLTVPAANAVGVPTNTAISATFSEAMNPATISGTTFTLVNTTLGTAVAGTVTYTPGSLTATFTPTAPATLPNGNQFTATITSAATDVAGSGLAGNTAVAPAAGNHVWTFTTGAAPDTTRPIVTLTVPTPGSANVANNTAISATFSEPMNAGTISAASFTLTNTTLGTAVAGTVSYSATSRTATFTPTAALASNSQFAATVSAAVTDLAGNGLAGNTAVAPAAGNHVWTFGTGAAPDTTRPTVNVTVPAAGAVGVATNSAISATFSEPMNASTINAASFTLTNTTLGSTVTGALTYDAGSLTATFTPTQPTPLANASQYTATITSAVTDLAGNALAGNAAVPPGAGNHVWTFTTGAAADSTPPTVTAVSPAAGSTGVCVTAGASATFSEAMDPATINNSTFVITDGGVVVPGSVSYNAASGVATFVPANAGGFAASRNFTATVVSGNAGVKDLAGNALAVDRVWSFTTGTQPCLSAPNLGTAANFGAFGGGAGVTNQGVNTVIGGNLGTTAACTLITGFHDAANVYTETPLNRGGVNGSIYCGPPAPGTVTTLAIATQAQADAQAAYNTLAALPPGSDPGAGQLGGRVLTAGVYTSAGGTFAITGGNLTLDAQGDANAIWVFQSAAALTVGLPAIPRSVFLINGAQAKNVFWQVGSAARIEDGSTMVGTIIAPAGVTISTAGQTVQTTLVGRAIGLTASVTVVNTTIVAP